MVSCSFTWRQAPLSGSVELGLGPDAPLLVKYDLERSENGFLQFYLAPKIDSTPCSKRAAAAAAAAKPSLAAVATAAATCAAAKASWILELWNRLRWSSSGHKVV